MPAALPNYHNYERRLELLQSRIWPEKFKRESNKKNEKIHIYKLTPRNKEILDDFKTSLENSNHSIVRIQRLLEWCAILGELIEKDLDKLEDADINGKDGLLAKLRKKYQKHWTLKGALVAFKQIQKFIHNDEPPKFITKMKMDLKLNKDYEKEILSLEEIDLLINTAELPNIRAMICACYFMGARVSELGLTDVKDFKFENRECLAKIRFSKTKQREILIMGRPAQILKEWFETYHPARNEKDYQNAPAFVSLKKNTFGNRLNYAAFCKHLRVIAEKANIKKPVNPHHLRHSYGTNLSDVFEMPVEDISMILGHSSVKTTMIYINKTMKDVRKRLREKQSGKPTELKIINDPFQIRDAIHEQSKIAKLEERLRIMEELMIRKIDPRSEKLPLEVVTEIVQNRN